MKVIFRLNNQAAKESGLTMDHANKIFKHRRFKYGIGQSVPTKFWNLNRCRLNLKGAGPRSAEFKKINQMLDKLEVRVHSYMQNNVDVSDESLRQHLNQKSLVGLVKQQKARNIAPEFFKWCYNHVRKNRAMLAPNTVKSKIHSLTILKKFASDTGTSIKFTELDREVFDHFVIWLKDKSYSPNTIWVRAKDLKAILREAERYKLEVNPDYRLSFFTVKQEESVQIYLNQTQLDALANLDLQNKPAGLIRTRDLFLIGANTGLRYSDIVSLDKNHFHNTDGGTLLKKVQIKTGNQVVVPVKPIVLDILNRYDWVLPNGLSNQAMNRYLKDLALMIGVTNPQMVCTHTARRSFATNAYMAGVHPIEIMRITGHKSEATFLKYIRASNEELAIRMGEMHNWFRS